MPQLRGNEPILGLNKKILEKDAYQLVDFKGNTLSEPRNRFYLKKYYA
jgi:hypothetical protein